MRYFALLLLAVIALPTVAVDVTVVDSDAIPRSKVKRCAALMKIPMVTLRDESPLYTNLGVDPSNGVILAALNSPVCSSDLTTACTFGVECVDGSVCVAKRYAGYTVWSSTTLNGACDAADTALAVVLPLCKFLVDHSTGEPLGRCSDDPAQSCANDAACSGTCQNGWTAISPATAGTARNVTCTDGTRIYFDNCP